MKRFFVLALVLGLVFAGCAQKAIVQPEESKETAQKAEVAKEEKKVEAAKEEMKETTKKELKGIETVPVKEVIEGGKVSFIFENIYFDFDKYDIRDDAKPVLKGISEWLMKSKSSRMTIEGHCDERGTNEYNLALGERRAKSTRDYLVSYGVEKGRFDIISYGEEKPLCREQTEDCWQKNRRAQFILKQQ
jgi:peptidoglycan-associated lipoprotein